MTWITLDDLRKIFNEGIKAGPSGAHLSLTEAPAETTPHEFVRKKPEPQNPKTPKPQELEKHWVLINYKIKLIHEKIWQTSKSSPSMKLSSRSLKSEKRVQPSFTLPVERMRKVLTGAQTALPPNQPSLKRSWESLNCQFWRELSLTKPLGAALPLILTKSTLSSRQEESHLLCWS